MRQHSRTLQLIEARLDMPLIDHVRILRAAGASWHAVSLDVMSVTGVPVTPETLRVRFRR